MGSDSIGVEMSIQQSSGVIEYRSPAKLYDPRLLTLVAVVSILLVSTMIAQGASHEVLHDARHAAGVACH